MWHIKEKCRNVLSGIKDVGMIFTAIQIFFFKVNLLIVVQSFWAGFIFDQNTDDELSYLCVS